MSDNDKGFILRHFSEKKSFIGSANPNVTMAIGDGYNDISMLKEATVGIQLFNPNVALDFGDII